MRLFCDEFDVAATSSKFGSLPSTSVSVQAEFVKSFRSQERSFTTTAILLF